ncbi:MAG: ThiF family adenylyltransferase [Immundisolibacter sp.]|uniref:HesA/MoeB/ThiF family protein n=1 Tax=Immundisolibacter sp. TaxID=1934948 RepID=UPI0019BADEAD|nr:ThiF family adenylyltransferase [Immundisolibacter sp.]MBC7161541.1 ThiF family adenylyltransferase [Immundisolibacter sp.]
MTDRYLRHNLIDWFDQELVKSLNILVVGAGAVGNEVIKNLVLLGVGAIRIVDFDRIEIHNLTRSVLFTEGDVGRNKAEAAAEAAQRLDPACRVEAIVGDFWDRISFGQLQESSVVFSCVDNFDARFRINRLCSLLGVDLINAGIDSRFASAEIFPFMRDSDSACFECNLPPSTYQRVADRYSCGWLRKVAYEERKIPTTAITASYAGAMATSLLLYSFRDDMEGGARRVFLDTITSNVSKAILPRNPACPCCATHFPRRTILQAQRIITSGLPWPQPASDLTVTCSDPILVSWETPHCATCSSRPSVPVFDLAANYDESHAMCSNCGLKQRLAVIREQFTVSELMERFSGRPLPGKFAFFVHEGTQVIVELMERDHD